jgi:hypothetical protein
MLLKGDHEGVDLLALSVIAACVHRHDNLGARSKGGRVHFYLVSTTTVPVDM